MMQTKFGIALFVVLVMLTGGVAAQGSMERQQLQQFLKKFPEADANQDGILSREEALTYQQKTAGKGKATSPKAPLPTPTHANVKYGPYERNVLDLWLAKSERPTPLVVFIHGGGFINGDKSNARPEAIRRCLAAGISFMAINYRFRAQAPIQDILRDAARAIQFIRLNAAKYNIDPALIASYGGSAGAGTSLWLAVHDDLADPKNDDPVLRQSTRIAAAGCMNGQATYDMSGWEKLIGVFKPEWIRGEDEDVKFYHFKSRDDFQTPEGKKILADCSMIDQITKDDPPIYLSCTMPEGEPTNRAHFVHHPKHAQAIKQRCDAVGVEAQIVLLGTEGGSAGKADANVIDFLMRQLAKRHTLQ